MQNSAKRPLYSATYSNFAPNSLRGTLFRIVDEPDVSVSTNY